MNTESPLLNLIDRLRLPAQDRTVLSFCGSSRASRVADWAAQLPATRINHTSVLLYQALPEITRLDTSASNRLAILEHLRPYVQQCIQGLSKNFLNQPLTLPDGAMKAAVVAQALQKHMSNGYCLVLHNILHQHPERAPKGDDLNKLGLALHRALTGQGLQLLRSDQLYTQTPKQLWEEANCLYRLAEELSLLKKTFADPLLKHKSGNTPEQVYIRILLLSCARPNQLRQQEVATLYEALENWSSLVHLTPAHTNSDNLFVLDLNSNLGPIDRSRLSESTPTTQWQELNLSALLKALAGPQESDENKEKGRHKKTPAFEIPSQLSHTTLNHVANAWGQRYQRRHQRLSSHNILEITVGLSNLHFHLAGSTPFQEFMQSSKLRLDNSSSRFRATSLVDDRDPWAQAFDAEKGHRTPANLGLVSGNHSFQKSIDDPQPKHPIYKIQLLDTSPGGYCLDWLQDIPSQAKAGEILGLREPGHRQWSIAVIRWVRQHRGSSHLGIQLLAPQVKPLAIQQLKKTGADGAYMRALQMPAVKATGQPETLITAALPFQEHDKIHLSQHGQVSINQLSHRLFASSAISQFSYRRLEAAARGAEPNTSAEKETGTPSDDFASDW